MKKVGKSKFFVKVLLVGLILIILLSSSLLVAFKVTTANTTLETENLTKESNSLKVVSADGLVIKNTFNNIKISELHDYTINAFIAKEDKRFYTHNGYDVVRIFGALKNNIKAGEIVEGGSTITQQLIKNTHTNSERTLKRKMNELKLAKQLEKQYTKDEILEMYLNNIYFGNNCYGLGQASITYFNVNASDLTLEQSAILAGLISAPSIYNPITNKELSINKGKLVLSLMNEQSLIDDLTYTTALKNIEDIQINNSSASCSQYISFAISEACQIIGVDELDQSQDIEIVTYLDYSEQQHLEKEITSKNYTFSNKFGITPDIGAVVIDNASGGIIAICGESQFNISTLKRQPASTIKPILVYAPAMEYYNYVPCSLILDEPININGYTPHNATKLNYGYTSIRDNIVRSTNIPAVKLLNEVGIERAKDFASKMGIQFNEQDNNLALALGGFTDGVTITELAGAYSTFARSGSYIKPTYIKSISINGSTVYNHNPNPTQVMEDSTAYLITDMLKSVAQYGTGRKIKDLGNFVASKTGTNATENNNMDAWNVSYTTEHTAVAWIGNTSGEDGSMHTSINGSTYPTLLVKSIFENMYSSSIPKNFEMPPSVTYQAIDTDLLESEHQIYLADEFTQNSKEELFKNKALPKTYIQEKIAENYTEYNFGYLFETRFM